MTAPTEFLGTGFPRALQKHTRISNSASLRAVLVPFSYGKDKKVWDVETQLESARKAFLPPPDEPLGFETAVVAGQRSDATASMVVLYLLQALKQRRPSLRAAWVPLLPNSAYKREDDLHIVVHADITVYYNVYHDSTPWRQETVRDLMTTNPNAKIVVTSGANPFFFAAQALRRPAHVALYCHG